MKTQLRFMTSEELHKHSYGEVLLPDTYNFRETPPSPVPTGLMCEVIFGPVVDYRCTCGALDGKMNIGARCHVCGVDIVSSSVRSERMGHISLSYPCIHPLAIKWLSLVLDISTQKLENVMYGKNCISFVEGSGNLVLNDRVGSVDVEERVPNNILEGSSFAISQIVDHLNLDQSLDLMGGKRAEILSRMRDGQQYILREILVSPPDYRPLLYMDGTWITSAINQLYVDILNRVNRVDRMKMYRPPSLIVLMEAIQLQKAVDRLFIDGITKKGVHYKSLLVGLSKKAGLFRTNLLGKRVDYSGRTVITSGPELKLDEAGIPIKMAKNLFVPFIINYFRKKGFKFKTIRDMIKNDDFRIEECLEVICKDHRIILNRQPTLHKLGVRAFKILLHSGKSIRLPSLVCGGFNADFDGDSSLCSVKLKIPLISDKNYNILCHIEDLENFDLKEI